MTKQPTPPPGIGYRIIDKAGSKWQEGDEGWCCMSKVWEVSKQGFFYPTVTYRRRCWVTDAPPPIDVVGYKNECFVWFSDKTMKQFAYPNRAGTREGGTVLRYWRQGAYLAWMIRFDGETAPPEPYEPMSDRVIEPPPPCDKWDTEILRLRKMLDAKKQAENLCPDCRDKVKGEPCQRCEVQKWKRKYDALAAENALIRDKLDRIRCAANVDAKWSHAVIEKPQPDADKYLVTAAKRVIEHMKSDWFGTELINRVPCLTDLNQTIERQENKGTDQ